MYTLFYSPGACSMAVHVALNEVGAQYELKKIDLHAPQKNAELLAVNSRHQVPVLVDGQTVVREGAAILTYLLDKHESPLMPQTGKARAAALEWLCFCNASLHPAYSLGFSVGRVSQDAGVQAAVAEFAVKKIQALWDDVEAHLGKQAFLAGEQPTVGDILMAVIANWSGKMPKPVVLGPNTKRVIKAMIERPSYKEALQSEQVEYKAAA